MKLITSTLIAKIFSLVMLLGVVAPATAHTYFFGLTDLQVNPKTGQAEIIHQFTSHDVEHVLLEFYLQDSQYSPAQYEHALKNYVDKHFQLNKAGKTIELAWLGYELVDGKVMIYQESTTQVNLDQVQVTQTMLIKYYPNQINTVNYKLNQIKGSLTFDRNKQSARISRH
jgi:hypothetical protein